MGGVEVFFVDDFLGYASIDGVLLAFVPIAESLGGPFLGKAFFVVGGKAVLGLLGFFRVDAGL